MPDLTPEEYVLEVEGIGISGTKTLTLEDLKTKFPKVTITAALQCAGNRRSEQNKVTLRCLWLFASLQYSVHESVDRQKSQEAFWSRVMSKK